MLFAIDACDREVIGWLATSAGISGEMVRDLMIACALAGGRYAVLVSVCWPA